MATTTTMAVPDILNTGRSEKVQVPSEEEHQLEDLRTPKKTPKKTPATDSKEEEEDSSESDSDEESSEELEKQKKPLKKRAVD